jgi:hypothetical protein
MSRMIIEHNPYPGLGRISLVYFSQEVDEFATPVAVGHQSMNMAAHKINTSEETQRSVANILLVSG